MKKFRFILSMLALSLAVAGAFAFNSPSTTAWFAVDENTGATGAYLGSTQPPCETQINKFCAAEYPGVSNGQPVGQRIQILSNSKRLTP